MKQLNGTITLSFLEEDNQQRVIFRIIPLCTREGVAFRTHTVEFPDQGSLRIVPDKREQSTFKERMRTMGCLCAIELLNEGKELGKVRQNRNYDPNQGEHNQFAIYSDVVCEFGPDGVFEVFDENAECGGALTPRVLIRRGKVLYGPIGREDKPDWAILKPFGNDSYLLQTVEMPGYGSHCFYWDPEQTLNWRQRRGALRRGKPFAEETADEPETGKPAEGEAPRPETAPIATVKNTPAARPETAAVQPVVVSETQPVTPAMQPAPKPMMPVFTGVVSARAETMVLERPETAAVTEPANVPEPEPAAEPAPEAPELAEPTPVEAVKPAVVQPEKDASLPIGTKLEILDGDISFEDQLSQLDQPLPTDANLLTQAASTPDAEETTTAPLHFSGTPLMRAGGALKAPLTLRSGDGVQNVVEREVREAHHQEGAYPTDFAFIDNPVEDLRLALDRAWDSTGTQKRALETLSKNEAFTQAFLKQLRSNGREVTAVQAAQDQLADIEAERLSLLMELESAQSEDKTAREALCSSLSQKKRDEITRMEERARALQAEIDSLQAALTKLGDQAQLWTLETLAANGMQFSSSDGETVTLSPRLGVMRTPEELIASVRLALGRQGFAVNEDDATELLTFFALADEWIISASTASTAELCASTLVNALGLSGVTACTRGNERLAVAGILNENERRTPTVEICGLSRAKVRAYGHRTLRVADTQAFDTANGLPVAAAPLYRPLTGTTPETASAPVALESLRAFIEAVAPLTPTGDKWLSELASLLEQQGAPLPETTLIQMRAFLAAASARLRGGFLAAADAAALSWAVPVALERRLDAAALLPALTGLPRALSALNLR